MVTLKNITVQQLLEWHQKAFELQENSWTEQPNGSARLTGHYKLTMSECIEKAAPNPEINKTLGLMIWSIWHHAPNDAADWLELIKKS